MVLIYVNAIYSSSSSLFLIQRKEFRFQGVFNEENVISFGAGDHVGSCGTTNHGQ